MLSVLLLILKIIGITIAVILGLLLLLVLIVLFVAVKYKGIAVKQGDDIRAGFKVTWLFHIVSVKVTFEDKELRYFVKIFGIQIMPKKEKVKDKHSDNVQSKAADELKPEEQKTQEQKAEEQKPEEHKLEEHTSDEQSIDEKQSEEKSNDENPPENPDDSKKSVFRKIIDKIRNIKYTIKSIYDKIKNILENIMFYKKVLTSELAHTCYAKVKKVLFKLLKHIAPRKLRGNLLIGFEDPATTGQILGYICMFYPIYGNNLNVRADFENKVLDADLKFKGRIRLYVLLVGALRLWRDKNIKKLIAVLKRGRR
ncbi:MAG: DUF2953 domain-containing protein [Lachnospiraceae bacterium]|nr:DUF2953 domain-containing protein [Lachnospiraceae bacterium]